jgi:hypothetical protein
VGTRDMVWTRARTRTKTRTRKRKGTWDMAGLLNVHAASTYLPCPFSTPPSPGPPHRLLLSRRRTARRLRAMLCSICTVLCIYTDAPRRRRRRRGTTGEPS